MNYCVRYPSCFGSHYDDGPIIDVRGSNKALVSATAAVRVCMCLFFVLTT